MVNVYLFGAKYVLTEPTGIFPSAYARRPFNAAPGAECVVNTSQLTLHPTSKGIGVAKLGHGVLSVKGFVVALRGVFQFQEFLTELYNSLFLILFHVV